MRIFYILHLSITDQIHTNNVSSRQLTLILKTGYDPNLMINARGQNGLQFMVAYYSATDAHLMRLQLPANKAAYLSIAKILLDAGIDPNTGDLLTGETVIFDAIRMNDREMVELLLSYVDLALRNKDGETVLMCAARFGSKQVLRMILSHLHELELDEYFLRQRNRFGLSALDLARAENIECAKVLTKYLLGVGQSSSSKLTRSASHHQLLAPMGPGLRFRSVTGARPVRTLAASLYDDPLASDYDSDFNVGPGPACFGQTSLARQNHIKQSMDARAAEFNQYLMSDQQMGPRALGSNQVALNTSDEDEYYQAPYGVSVGGGLTRSRSCIVGPQTSEARNKRDSQSTSGARIHNSGGQSISSKSK